MYIYMNQNLSVIHGFEFETGIDVEIIAKL